MINNHGAIITSLDRRAESPETHITLRYISLKQGKNQNNITRKKMAASK